MRDRVPPHARPETCFEVSIQADGIVSIQRLTPEMLALALELRPGDVDLEARAALAKRGVTEGSQ